MSSSDFSSALARGGGRIRRSASRAAGTVALVCGVTCGLLLGAAPAGATTPSSSGTSPQAVHPALSPDSAVGYGSAYAVGGKGDAVAPDPVIGIAALPDGGGYWLATSNGDVIAVGAAPPLGNLLGRRLNKPIVGIAATADGRGYWLVAGDGGIFSFGDARFHGSTGAMRLNKPILGMASTASGRGYWLVAGDGGIFSFGDARFHGSTGAMRLNKPIVGMASTSDGKGYWLVASDGGIFSFGDAHFHGSTGAMHLNRPIVGMAAAAGGEGYWLVAQDGGVFCFGKAATFEGSGVGSPLDAPAVGIAARPGGYWIAFGQTALPSTVLGQNELLAELGYLPLQYSMAAGFVWRWKDPPAALRALWRPAAGDVMLEGAITQFQLRAGLDGSGSVDAATESALVAAESRPAAYANPNGYTYALASEASPETLTIWHDGSIVLQSLANTGIAASPTAQGTWPVYERLQYQVMRGTNPDGTPYADPVWWVAYFNGSDAVHYFPRASFGWPQSLGCVELPWAPAETAWGWLSYGTLVTVD